MFELLTGEEIQDAERAIADRKRKLDYAKWDAELVGRYFRIIRTPHEPSVASMFGDRPKMHSDDYVTLERSLAVASWPDGKDNVYADVVFLHIRSRDDRKLTCSGFEVSNARREEPYLKIQPVFYSYDDFRKSLGSWNHTTGPTKHVDEISKEEYAATLGEAVANFMAHCVDT